MTLTLDIARALAGRLFLLVALVAWGSLAVAPAQAQDARARARTHFNQGVADYDAGRYREALAAFEQAYRAAPHPTVRVNMANCFEQLGQYVEALFNYRRFLEESGANVTPEQRSEVEQAIARIEPKVGTLVIKVEPRQATLTIDGKEARRSPDGTLQLVAGLHYLSASAPGHVTVERSVDVKGGAQTPVSINLSEESAVPVAASSAAEPLDVATDDEAPPADAPADAPQQSRVLLWSALGLTAGLLVAGGVTGGLALKYQSEFDTAVARSNDSALSDEERAAAELDGADAADRADRNALLADVFLGAALVSGGASLWIWLRGRKQSAQSSVSLRLGPMMPRRGAGGIGVGGRF
jgi:tetratricopeptide (TPR) repeat protein